MGGIDIANQLRESYKTHKATQRNWWPLFYWLIDVTVINSYRLYRVHMAELGQQPLSHLDFRIGLYTFLFAFHIKAKLRRLQLALGGNRLFNPDFPGIHIRVQRGVLDPCV